MYSGIQFSSQHDIEKLSDCAYRVLEQVGVSVEYTPLADLMVKAEPSRIRMRAGRALIDRSLAESCFFACGSDEFKAPHPRVHACAELYEGLYLDAETNEFLPWTERRLLDYIKLAKKLPHVGNASMLGCPVTTLDRRKQPLYEKYYTAKFGLETRMGGYAIWDTALCEPIYALWSALAEERGRPLEDVFRGGVYIISPLKLGKVEAEHLLWFRERKLRCFIGCMSALGMNAPITPAGAIVMQLAELMFASVLSRVLYGEPAAHIWSAVSAADLGTLSFRYGRPEQLMINNAMSDIAYHYGLPYWGHDGLCDAKLPSGEAAAQKMATALAHLMKGRCGGVAAGLLSVDEIASPVQMVIDNELAGYLSHVAQGFEISERTLAIDDIEEACLTDGSFLGTELTVDEMRRVIWQSRVYSSNMYAQWKLDKRIDVDYARDIALSIIRDGGDPEPQISERCEKKMLQIIENS